MTKARFRTCRPPPGLSALVNRPGGMLRETAIARARAGLEGQRAPAQKILLGLVAELEAASDAALAADRDLRRKIDAIIALADTFDMVPLANTGRRLSDLIQRLAAQGVMHPKAIAVHLRAMHLFCGPQSDTAVAGITGELDRVWAHVQAQVPATVN